MPDVENATVSKVDPDKKQLSKSDDKKSDNKSVKQSDTQSVGKSADSEEENKKADDANGTDILTGGIPSDKSQSVTKRAGKAIATNMAVSTGAQILTQMFIMRLLLLLKNMFMNAVGAVAGFFQSIAGVVMNSVHAVVGAVSTAFSFVTSSAINMAVAATTTVAIVVTAVVGTAAADFNWGKYTDAYVDDCMVRAETLNLDTPTYDTNQLDNIRNQNIKEITVFFKYIGWNEAQITGLCANIQNECGFDPTVVEGIYDSSEAFTMTGKKKKTAASVNFNRHQMIAKGVLSSTDIYKDDGAYRWIQHMGIGICQWPDTVKSNSFYDEHKSEIDNDTLAKTDANYDCYSHTALKLFAQKMGMEWYTLDVQLAFMVTQQKGTLDSGSTYVPGSSNGNSLKNGKISHESYELSGVKADEGVNGAKAAADILCYGYFVPGDTASQSTSRQKNVESKDSTGKTLYERVCDYYANSSMADDVRIKSLLNQAGTVVSVANDDTKTKFINGCRQSEDDFVDNSSIAAAALSFAWKDKATWQEQDVDTDKGGHGTDLYKTVIDAVLRNEPRDAATNYKSCDRCVAAALRWSGADDNVPSNSVAVMRSYFDEHSDLYKKINVKNGNNSWWANLWASNGMDALQPGDILIEGNETDSAHILIYVGEAMWKSYFYPEGEIPADVNACSLVAASYGDHGAYCQPWYYGDDFTYSTSNGTYYLATIYRYVGTPNRNSEYYNAVKSINVPNAEQSTTDPFKNMPGAETINPALLSTAKK